MKPDVTIIIATYNRPEALKSCIQSVLNQTVKNWILYVVGDNCSDETGTLMESYNDPRIFYFNNPLRFGEQSGCNSIGMALAETEYIAFLNHDDLWTPDHLETAIHSLESDTKAGFYVGRSVFSRENKNSTPVLNDVSPIDRTAAKVFHGNFSYIEPCSTWVLKTKAANKIGYWKQSIDIYRIPVIDFFLRAWHKKIKFIFSRKISCVKLCHHSENNSDDLHYSYQGSEAENLLDLMKHNKTEFEKQCNLANSLKIISCIFMLKILCELCKCI